MQVPTLKNIEGFRVTGLSTRTRNADEFDEKKARLPALWQELYSSNLAIATTVFGVYSDYASDASNFYTVTIGINSDNTSNKMSSIAIEPGNYLVFHAKGPMPSTVIETWKCVWDYFAVENQYQRRYMTDFEVYKNEVEVDIYIGIN